MYYDNIKWCHFIAYAKSATLGRVERERFISAQVNVAGFSFLKGEERVEASHLNLCMKVLRRVR